MKEFILFIGSIVLLLVSVFLINKNSENKANERLQTLLMQIAEKSYAEGQRDAINGDIRLDIKRNCWLKSPWEKTTPIGLIKTCKDTE